MNAKKKFYKLGFKLSDSSFMWYHPTRYLIIRFDVEKKNCTIEQRTMSRTIPAKIDLNLSKAILKQLKEINKL